MAYTSPFAALSAFANFAKQAALPLFQPGHHLLDGTVVDKLAFMVRAWAGQNGQPPAPIQVTDLFASGTIYRSFTNAAGANPGGGQASATPVISGLARFGTVATAGDSAVLPAAVPGAHPIIANAGAAAMNLYPAPGEAINALAANTPFSIPSGRMAVTMCTAPGVWSVGLLATS